MEEQTARHSPYVYICGKHPMVTQTIESIIRSDSTLDHLQLGSQPSATESTFTIQIVDAFSVPEWRGVVYRRQSAKIRNIIVLPQNSLTRDEEYRSLQLNVHGLVYVSPKLNSELPEAIHAVLEGQLWVKWDLREKESHRLLTAPGIPSSFTLREEQIVDLLFKGLANKRIGDVLEISERTVKFHVSNILHKFQVNNRRQLLIGGVAN